MAKRIMVFSLTVWDKILLEGFIEEAKSKPERREELIHVMHQIVRNRLLLR